MELHMVAIVPRAGTRHHLLHRRILKFADPQQLVTQNFSLCLQLFFIRQMLIMASAADAEMFTAREYSMWRCFKDFQHFSAGKVALLLRQPDANALPRQPKRDEDCPAILQASHGIAAISKCGEDSFLFHKKFGRPGGRPDLSRIFLHTCTNTARICNKFTEGKRKEQPTQQ